MLAKCWLHIGVEKTGTTSIQSYLAANRAALRAQGRLYPQSPGPVGHLNLVAFALDDWRIDHTRKVRGLVGPAQIASFRKDFLRSLEEEIAASGATEIILSSELLSSRLRSARELERIRSFCAQIAQHTKIVVYLRNQPDLLVSRYTTIIQRGGRDAFQIRGVALGDYARLLERWATAFGEENMIVRRFEATDFVNGDLLQDFATAIALEPAKLVSIPRYNESLDTESLIFLRAINRRVPRWLSERISPLRSAAVTVLQRRRGGTKFVIPPTLANRIENHFRASNEKVSAEYFGGRHQPLFSPPTLVGKIAAQLPNSVTHAMTLRLSGYLLFSLPREALRRFRRTNMP